MRIEHYFLMTNYALWEVIVNGDTSPKRIVDGVEQTYTPTTAEEKLVRKNELKARGTLLVALLNKHQLKFNSYKDSKLLMEAIEKRFEVIVNGDTSPPKRIVDGVEQTYTPTTAEEKLVRKNELKARGTLLIALLNKHQLKFNSYKDSKLLMEAIEKRFEGRYESKVIKKFTFRMKDSYLDLENTSSTNQAHDSNSTNTKSLSDAVIYSFFANQSNSLQLDKEDLKQIDANDLEKMDLKWQMAMLTMRARRFLKKFRRNIGTNGSETIGAPRENRNREPIRRNVIVESTDAKALVAQNGFRYDWSDQAEEGPTNFAFMAYTSSSSSSSSSSDSEARLVVYKKNEEVFEDNIKILKVDILVRDKALTELRNKVEKVDKERYDVKLTLEKFEHSSKTLNKMLDSQVNDTNKIGIGYHAVPPPFTGNFMPSRPDLILALDEDVMGKPVTSVHAVTTSEDMTSEYKPKSVSEPLIEDLVSDSEDENETNTEATQRQNWKIKEYRYMTGNMSFLTDYEEIDGGYVAFGGNLKGGKITGKGKIRTATKDETSGILKAFITRIKNLIDHRVKIIRCDNGTKFKNKEMNQFYEKQGIKREFSVPRTPQQNRVAERKNRTLIKAAKTMPADLKILSISFMRPFGCPVTIHNTLGHLGKFDEKADEGFFVRYSMNSKTFRVFNSRTRIVEETLHVTFLDNKPNVAGSGRTWFFDIDTLTSSMNYKPVITGNQSNGNVGAKNSQDDVLKPSNNDSEKVTDDASQENEVPVQEKEDNINSSNSVNTACSLTVNAANSKIVNVENLPDDPNMHELEEIVYATDDEHVGAEADINNFDKFITISPIPTTRVHKDHSIEQVIGDLHSATQSLKNMEEHGFVSTLNQGTNHKDLQNCVFACFLSQEEPKKVIQALQDPSWIEVMQDELLQFKLQQVWTLVDLPNGKRAIGTK
nr:hypothetical protein [Tanacetum cinerariifolium]